MILCLGTTPVYQRSMVFESLRPNDVNRASAVHDYASGKSVNVARVLHALGEDVLATGFVGRGGRGDALLADLDQAGVPHDFVRVAAPARQCVTVIDRAAGTATELVEESTPVAPEDWDCLDLHLADLIPKASACVFSGSLPPGAPNDFYYTCLEAFCGQEQLVILDTRGQALRRAQRAAARSFIPKLNHDEYVETFGAGSTTEDGLRETLQFLPPPLGCAVITQGPRGAIVVDSGRKRAWRVVPPKVVAKSAVGSGDAFAAGMMAALVRGKPIEEAAALGAACGAANAMTDLAGHLLREDLDAILTQVRVEPFLMDFI